jgi:hypothetical protein
MGQVCLICRDPEVFQHHALFGKGVLGTDQ